MVLFFTSIQYILCYIFSDNFMMFKMDVAKQAINSRSGKAIPPKVRGMKP